MRRQLEFLVEKRDGRREWLRTTKLARSIAAALAAGDGGDDWLATDLAAAVIVGLRGRGQAGVLRTAEVAEAVRRVLIAAGQPAAAARHAAVGAERTRRRMVMVPAAAERPPAWRGVTRALDREP